MRIMQMNENNDYLDLEKVMLTVRDMFVGKPLNNISTMQMEQEFYKIGIDYNIALKVVLGPDLQRPGVMNIEKILIKGLLPPY